MTGSKTVKDEIMSYELPESVKSKAIQIHDEIKDQVGTCRSSVRKQLLYFLIHNAFLELGEVPIQSEIVVMCNVDDSSISKALKQFSWPRTNYRMKNDDSKPRDFLPHYARVMGVREDAIHDLLNQCDKWTNYRKLQKMPVIVVTAAVLKYYMDISGLSVDWKKITTTFNISKVVIEQAYSIISSMDNE